MSQSLFLFNYWIVSVLHGNYILEFEIKIIGEHLRAIKPEDGTALLDISLRNLSTNPVTIVSGILIVKDYQNKVRSKHVVYGFESEMGAVLV